MVEIITELDLENLKHFLPTKPRLLDNNIHHKNKTTQDLTVVGTKIHMVCVSV